MDQSEPQASLEPPDPAAAAFEALTAEVAALGRRIEAQMPAPAPDYALTLGAMLEQLRQIEAHPAMSLTPENYMARARKVAEVIKAEFTEPLQADQRMLREAVGLVQGLAGPVHEGQVRLKQLGIALGVGVLSGAFLGAWVAVFAFRHLGL
jgi:hypothetical protein